MAFIESGKYFSESSPWSTFSIVRLILRLWLLRAQTAQLDATTGYLAALQDWQVAGAQLERAAGVLTPESALITGAGRP